ncbi:hypothetical protein TBLA_0D02370 [Henningerozyma blattae CBS 6284]|uniref:Iron transport multicopper oxidase FET3 n=1 Tax=Henningerozyma blattae (strain ATCC 34711 / CBS 6284 / DSM 70876 / NBRC 10599 / NRRL Y-10934 / UCD 77-7) TaxID=1071380 RepID=I2H2Y9_HENB6|nr:hypothetical protein TBLA_0D02370 [Tetrapisispora blattae CBS 6284]CCH60741.1 hypothetical protein TBLA_0D02370 [Tetrapisispora blattae CBS 6284]
MTSLHSLHSLLTFFIVCLSQILVHVHARTVEFDWTLDWIQAAPDGFERPVIAINGRWPPPALHVTHGDRVVVHVTNNLDQDTSLHFHGLFQRGSIQMDGPAFITQCPIPPGGSYTYDFVVDDQMGTFWYHAHLGSQYGDGFRGVFVIHSPEDDMERDMTFIVSDWYHDPSSKIMPGFMTRYNPMGNEPIPDAILFNDYAINNSIVLPEKSSIYTWRFVNAGLFVGQYLYSPSIPFNIIEVDGVLTKPKQSHLIYISAGQRIALQVNLTENVDHDNLFLYQYLDDTMLDTIPSELQLNKTIPITFANNKPPADLPPAPALDLSKLVDEFELTTREHTPRLPHYDTQITFNVTMNNLIDGVNYAFFNNITYTRPNIPVLSTVLTAPKDLLFNPAIYGTNINVNILKPNSIVEIVLNNQDPGRHPFHIHGHNFQIIQKSPIRDDETDELPYDEAHPLLPIPAFPIVRDTAIVEPNGHLVIRFKADNPGVWIFHCHVNWHLDQGLAAVFVEDPVALQESTTMTDQYKSICLAQDIPIKGNAAGNSHDWLDLKGLNVQPTPLPNGFIWKGYLAMFLCTAIAIYGFWSIIQYGLLNVVEDDEIVVKNLTELLQSHDIPTT